MSEDRLGELVARLAAPEAPVRERALDELSDVFERSQPKTTAAVAEIKQALESIQGLLERETEPPAVVESALHALATAAASGLAPLVSWDGLAARIERWAASSPLLEYVLLILGGSGDGRHRPLVARFASHHDSTVRTTAKNALAELDGH